MGKMKIAGMAATAIAGAGAIAAHILRKRADETVYTAELMEPIQNRKKGVYETHVKRGLDVACATGAVVCFSPLYIVIAALVRFKLGTPVLFTQERPGLIGPDGKEKIFKMYKFRTMTDERDNNGELLPDNIRLTKFGAWLRSTSLDELPEAFNILNGTMSVIGPRPQLVRDMVFMTNEQRMRHTAKPGLSGLAQINGRNAIAWKDKIEWDIKYSKNVSFLSDLKLVGKTALKVLRKEESTKELDLTFDYGDALLSEGKISQEQYDALQMRAKSILAKEKPEGTKKKIWLINHYAVPPQYYPLARPSLFAKNLIKMGYDVTIVAASTIHNSEKKNLIEGDEKVKHIVDDGVPYVLINCRPYKGNGMDRVRNILEFSRRLPKILDSLEKPDVIVATSFDPLSCYEGIKYAKKHGITAIAEIADLWPETLVAYGVAHNTNPIVKALRIIEKRIYENSDAIVFTMEGGKNYIIDQKWDLQHGGTIDLDKISYINNGVDLNEFNYYRDHFQIDDIDLNNTEYFKVIYAGSIRKVNNLTVLLNAAKQIDDPKIKFLIWGAGDEVELLQKRVIDEHIDNVVFKGVVEKKYVPYIVSMADLNILPGETNPIYRYGISPNKMFDYLAAGKPQLVTLEARFNPAEKANAGTILSGEDTREIAEEIMRYANMGESEYEKYCQNAQCASKEYDFEKLTRDLVNVIENAYNNG